MTKKEKPLYIILGIIGFLLIAFALVSVLDTKFSVINEEVFIPQYFTGECIARADNLQEVAIISHTDAPTFYHCNTQGAIPKNSWIPIYPGIQCSYTVSDWTAGDVYICKGITTNVKDLKDKNKCQGDLASLFGDKQVFTVDAGDTIYIDTDTIFGIGKVSARYPSYGLQFRQQDGYLHSTTTNCLLSSKNSDLHTINLGDRFEVKPDMPFNAVSGIQRAFSNQLISLKGVENGEIIYITRPGFYAKLKMADDGIRYVDLAVGREIANSLIECIPRTIGCSDEAKIISLEKQACDKFGGAIVGYAPVKNNPQTICKYQCSNNILSKTSDCINIPQKCPQSKPLFDAVSGQCVKVLTTEPRTKTNLTPIFILLGGIVLIMITYQIRKKK